MVRRNYGSKVRERDHRIEELQRARTELLLQIDERDKMIKVIRDENRRLLEFFKGSG